MTSTGRWKEVGRIWRQDGKDYFTVEYLREKFADIVPSSRWFRWVKVRCPDLDPRKNRSRINTRLIEGTEALCRGGERRVYAEDDIERIVERRRAGDCENDPGGLGRWESEDIYVLTRDLPECGPKAGDLLYTYAKAMTVAGVSKSQIQTWCATGHKALGRPVRFHRVFSSKRTSKGIREVPVVSAEDIRTIRDWRTHQKVQTNGRHPRGVAAEKIAKAVGMDWSKKHNRVMLGIVLKQFRKATEAGWQRGERWNMDLNSAVETYGYDVPQFKAWLAGRSGRPQPEDVNAADVEAVAKTAPTGVTAERRERQTQKAVSFLTFVFTRGYYQAHRFLRFYREPPAGELLEAYKKPILGADIFKWAREAGISRRYIWPAKRHLKIVDEKVGFRGQSFWRLTEPISVPPAASPSPSPDAVTRTTSTADVKDHVGAPASRTRRGRTSDPDTERMQKYCFEEYNRGGKLAAIRCAAARLFGSLAPKEDAHVTTYAQRYAKKKGLLLTRGVPQKA